MDSYNIEDQDPKRSIAHTLRAALIAAGAAILLWRVSDILLLVFTSVLLAVLLRGFAEMLRRAIRLPIGLSLLLVTLLILGAIAGFGYFIGQRFAGEGQQLAQALAGFFQHAQQQYGNTFWGKALRHLAGSGSAVSIGPLAPKVLSATFGTAGGLVLLVVMTLYLAAAPGPYINGTIRLVPLFYRDRAGDIMARIGRTLRLWMLGQLVSMATVGVLATIGLMLLHVQLPVALGVLAGLLTFIPYLGAIFAAIPAVIIASGQGAETILWVVLLYVGCHLVEGYLVSPLVTRRTVHLPPAVTLVAISAFGAMFGFLGILVATPLAAVIIVLVQQIYVRDILGDPNAAEG